MMLPWQKRPLALNSPRDLPGLALWLDSKDVSSLRNGAGAQPVTTDGIKLASDKSGNSSVNVLCLNGVAGNNASAPNAVPLQIVADIDFRAKIDVVTLASGQLISKWPVDGQLSYQFLINDATGILRLNISPDGTGASSRSYVSTVGISAGTGLWVRGTLQVNNGSGKSVSTFYTSPDGTNWTQLGAQDASQANTSIFNGNGILEIGTRLLGTQNMFSGNIARAQIYAGLTGTDLRFDANFATAAKLATSFTESSSNAATVTINTSGATGARISGARDLYQGTAANQPILTIAASGNCLTFDGSNDYLKAAAFGLAQPETVYFVGSQVSWTDADCFYAGNVNGAAVLVQNTTTPNIAAYSGTFTTNNAGLSVGTNGVITAVFNNASSLTRVNRSAAVTGTTGATGSGGFTLAANGNGSTGFANITAQEVLVYSGAHDKATQDRVIAYLANRNRIALT